LEVGYQKIAIYVNAIGKPKHAAVQLPGSDEWSSKLGEEGVDISHKTLKALEDAGGGKPLYGKASCFLKRPTPINMQATA
jgi:hypothetical protein